MLPILTLLLFGVVEFGTVFNTTIAFRQGVREGARQGVVANFGTTSNCSLHGTTGASANIQNLMCLTKNRIGGDPNAIYVKVAFDTTYSSGQGLIVCAQRSITSFTGLFSAYLNGKFYKTKVEMSIEQVSGTNETAGAEDVSGIGGTWSWCTATTPSP